MVCKEGNKVNKNDYMEFWGQFLKKIFHWSESDVRGWFLIHREQEDMGAKGKPGFFFHSPVYYISHLLIPDEIVYKLVAPQLLGLKKRLQEAIEEKSRCKERYYDFNAAKKQVEDVLAEFGYSIPNRTFENSKTITEWLKDLDRINRPFYIQFWKALLRELWNWSDSQVLKWSLRQQERMDYGNPYFYKYPPAYHVLHLLIPETLIKRLDVNWFHLYDQLQNAIQGSVEHLGSEFDFKAAKQNVQDVLSQYGEFFPEHIPEMTQEEEDGKNSKPFYLRFWATLLKETIGWSDEQTLEWAQQYEDGLDGKISDPWFYHEAPPYYVVPLFISEKLKNRLDGMELRHLKSRLESIVEGRDDRYRYYERDFDFKTVRTRIEEVLAEYGETLDAVR